METHNPEEDPREALPDSLDPEAHLLCALMNSLADDNAAAWVLEYLHPGDFYNPMYGEMFAVLQGLVGGDLSAVSVNAQLQEHKGEGSRVYRDLLVSLFTLGTLPARIISLADDVLGGSYRRQFFAMTQSLTDVAMYAKEQDLFDTLVTHGKLQRGAWDRRQAFMAEWKKRST